MRCFGIVLLLTALGSCSEPDDVRSYVSQDAEYILVIYENSSYFGPVYHPSNYQRQTTQDEYSSAGCRDLGFFPIISIEKKPLTCGKFQIEYSAGPDGDTSATVRCNIADFSPCEGLEEDSVLVRYNFKGSDLVGIDLYPEGIEPIRLDKVERK